MPAATIQYIPVGSAEIHSIRLPWAVATGLGTGGEVSDSAFSVSVSSTIAAQCGSMLHDRDRMRETTGVDDPMQVSTFPDSLDFQFTNGPGSKAPSTSPPH